MDSAERTQPQITPDERVTVRPNVGTYLSAALLVAVWTFYAFLPGIHPRVAWFAIAILWAVRLVSLRWQRVEVGPDGIEAWTGLVGRHRRWAWADVERVERHRSGWSRVDNIRIWPRGYRAVRIDLWPSSVFDADRTEVIALIIHRAVAAGAVTTRLIPVPAFDG